MHDTFLIVAVKRVAISRIKQNTKPVGPRERRPIAIANTFLAVDRTRTNPVAIILQATCDPVNRLRVV